MKRWLYFLLDDQGRSYKESNGNVSATAQPTPLPYTPDAWQDITIGWERNLNRYGIVRNFSVPLGFVKTANFILRKLSLTGTVETKLFLLIKKLDAEVTNSTYRFLYKYFYKGELDLSTVELDDDKSTVNIMEGGLMQKLAANEDVTFEFPLDDPEAIDVLTDGFTIPVTANYAVMEQDITDNNDYFMPVAYLSSDSVVDASIQHTNCYLEYVIDPAQYTEGTNFMFRIDPQTLNTFRIFGEFKINVTGGINRNFGFQVRSGNSVYYASGAISYAPGQHTIPFDEIITIPLLVVGPQPFFFHVIPGQAAVDLERSEFFIKYNYRFKPTITKAFTPDVLFRKLTGKVCDGEQFAQSDLFDANKNIVITSGDALRGFADAKIKTTLKDFFTSYNCWYNIGMSIENKKLRIEEKSFYFDESVTPFELGNAKDLKLSFASDLMYNKLKVGYPEKEYDQSYGRFEFNNTSIFTTPITRIVKEFDITSPYRADPTGVEVTRINLEGKTTTDNSKDNDVFALNIDIANPNVDDSYNLLRPTYDTIEGIPDESKASIFNIDLLTPKRILKKHGNWIRSIFYGFEDKRLKFQTTQKNRELRTVIGSVLVDEDLDELIGNMDQPLFKPWYFEFNCNPSTSIVEALETNPNQPFSFEWEGKTFIGFLIKAGIAPDSNKEQTVKLLSAPQNDLTKFI